MVSGNRTPIDWVLLVLDIAGKLVIPTAAVVIAYASLKNTEESTAQRLAFDAETKKIELRQREDDLFIRKNDSQRAKDNVKAEFFQKNFNLIASKSENSKKQLEVLASAEFSSIEDLQDITAKIALMRMGLPDTAVEAENSQQQKTAMDYKAFGLRYAGQNNFAMAASYFGNATALNPNDAETWNFKAYAEMRIGKHDDAFKSISNAISLNPREPRLMHITALNATKILCSMDNNTGALDYLRSAISAIPSLSAVAANDVELKQKCNFSFDG